MEQNRDRRIPPSGFSRMSGARRYPREGKGVAVASMVVGILAYVSCLALFGSLLVSVLLGGVAIGFSVTSRVLLGRFHGMAVAGLILGISAVVIHLFFLLLMLWMQAIGAIPPDVLVI